MTHDHASDLAAGDRDRSRRLSFALSLTVGVLLAEALGAWLSGSLALLSDAGHVFADAGALALSLVALRLACRAPTARRTYGLHRAEILAALLNGLTLFAIAVLIGREAWQRLWAPPQIQTTQMLVVAVVGLAANWLVLTRLAAHHGDLNLRGAYLHVLGDLLASLGVVAGAVLMRVTGWYVADPILSALIGLLILGSAWRLTAEALHILLLGVPRHLKVKEVADAMLSVGGVTDVHNVRLWAACSNVCVLSAHVVVCAAGEAERVRIREDLRELLRDRYHVAEATLELEETACPAAALVHPLPHPEDHHGHGHDH